MSDELKAASESVSWIEHNRHTSTQWDLDAFQEFYERDIDALLPLAKSYLADLAAREAEERERALPIDAEWLRSIGFVNVTAGPFTEWLVLDAQAEFPFQIDAEFYDWEDEEPGKFVEMNVGDDITLRDHPTRGQILDLLAGLKIPTKENVTCTFCKKSVGQSDVDEVGFCNYCAINADHEQESKGGAT